MTTTESLLLAAVRAQEPQTALDLGHRCSVPHEALYGALVRLEAMGLLRITVDHSNRQNRNKQQAMWETA